MELCEFCNRVFTGSGNATVARDLELLINAGFDRHAARPTYQLER